MALLLLAAIAICHRIYWPLSAKSNAQGDWNPVYQGYRICVGRECEAPAELRFSIEHKLGRSLALPHFASNGPYAIALPRRWGVGFLLIPRESKTVAKKLD
jgi:hypothetical protein